jgi:hypothetical protein
MSQSLAKNKNILPHSQRSQCVTFKTERNDYKLFARWKKKILYIGG